MIWALFSAVMAVLNGALAVRDAVDGLTLMAWLNAIVALSCVGCCVVFILVRNREAQP